MADALCGPSNPLQSFQKHTQVDRTLLQDRITGPRPSPAQGFRTRDPRTGSLDADFAAFEAGRADPFQVDQPFLRANPLAQHTPISGQNGAAAGWATDFQNLHISNQPIPSHQFRTEAPLLRSNGWQSEFAAHQPNGRSVTAQGKQVLQPSSQSQYAGSNWQSNQLNFNNGYMNMAPRPYSYGQQQPLQQQQQFQQQAEPLYDEAGFADAFEQASQHAQGVMEAGETGLMEREGSDLLHKDALPMDRSDLEYSFPSLIRAPSPTQFRIGSDAIRPQDQQTKTPDQDSRDADELARTAGQLLTSVQHDTSDKFQNSQFLALMRRIRDGEVRVQGEDFKETYGNDNMSGLEDPSFTDAHQLHPGGRFYPEQSPHLRSATMSGGLLPSTTTTNSNGGITAADLHHFDQMDESPGLSSRYHRVHTDDDYGVYSTSPSA